MSELLAFLLQVFAEIAMLLFAESSAEVGSRRVRRRRPFSAYSPFLAFIGYALLGAGAGGFSLLIVPELFIQAPLGQVTNLVVTPLVAGVCMGILGTWRTRRGEEHVLLDRFSYGYVFALAMTLVRFIWGGGV